MECITTLGKPHLLQLLLELSILAAKLVGFLPRRLQLGGHRLLASRLLADTSQMHIGLTLLATHLHWL